MVLATATVSGVFFLPDGVTHRRLHVTVVPVLNGVPVSVRSASEGVILSGSVRAHTVDGVLTVTLPLLSGLQPAGVRWRARFRTFTRDRRPPPPQLVFDLTGDASWVALAAGQTSGGTLVGSTIPRTIPFVVGGSGSTAPAAGTSVIPRTIPFTVGGTAPAPTSSVIPQTIPFAVGGSNASVSSVIPQTVPFTIGT